MTLLYPDKATLWSKGPEVNRKATWTRFELPAVHWEEKVGSTVTLLGETIEDALLVLVPCIPGTISLWIKKGDRIALGIHEEDEPAAGAKTITSCEPVRRAGRIHHIEIIGEGRSPSGRV